LCVIVLCSAQSATMDLLEFTLDVGAKPTKQSARASQSTYTHSHFYVIDWEISGVIAACFSTETARAGRR
jgi:hypothetical protein